jgi:starch synthase
VVHANDWHTGLIPFFIKQSQQDPFWGGLRTVCTIHNMAYQGDNAGKWLYEEGIPARQHRLLHQIGAADKLLAIGIAYANYVTTVSPRHAVEIQFEPLGCGLSQLIRSRNPFVSGILNGIATNQLNPATDPYLMTNFDSTDFRQKRLNNKRHLQQLAGLPLRDEVMLIGIVSRIVWQKGFDFLIPALWEFMGMADAQLVILGTGELSYSDQFRYMQQAFPSKVRAEIRYDEGFAQKVYGGGDIFVMPSHYEPCGIGQMVAMRYGSLPLVRETGGLADTVSNYDNGDADHGTGFVFLADRSCCHRQHAALGNVYL